MDTQLAQNTAARKERLIALRRRKEAQEKGESVEAHFAFKQRNFDPETRQARKATGPEGHDTVEKEVEGLAEEIVREDEERRAEELDLFNIQPRRPNWDLKRDMSTRMGKLERKTNEAIATILRQRLREQRGGAASEQVDLVAGIREAEAERDRDVESDGSE
ncbi:mRNA splicing factor [Cutaneotrichosporon oleaginosum]|uniref:mRNA splicing factor n=1 Tax=Cutaneotrichosporon oleaginosum TaxID=879819 RepID=A0A0J1BAH8_9TREE|nr:mRNA splicing factor [Cutaneotrichosporon oleaginosum]KLT44909.1 mRNA splicing factor [Cutaneotrichosporon oleaginosum]TXT12037.1 hypothetical protein COLE_02447 [Cutaneotrichosporon oleaginosum]